MSYRKRRAESIPDPPDVRAEEQLAGPEPFAQFLQEPRTARSISPPPLRSTTPPPEYILEHFDELVKNCDFIEKDCLALAKKMARKGAPNPVRTLGFNIFTGEVTNPPKPPVEEVKEEKKVEEKPKEPRKFVRPPEEPTAEQAYMLRNQLVEYPKRKEDLDDAEVTSRLTSLIQELDTFTKDFCSWQVDTQDGMIALLKQVLDSPGLMHYMTWSTISPLDIFHELFENPEERRFLVFSVLSRALKMWVFDDLFFGASESHQRAMHAQDIAGRHLEGFSRAGVRKAQINSLLDGSRVPEKFELALRTVTGQLYTLIRPLILPAFPAHKDYTKKGLHPRLEEWYPFVPAMHGLYRIVQVAALLSVDMRARPDDGAVYYFNFPSKDSPIDAESMSILNDAKSLTLEVRAGEAAAALGRAAWYGEEQWLEQEHQAKKAAGEKVRDRHEPVQRKFPQPSRKVKTAVFPEVSVFRPGGPNIGQEKKGFRFRTLMKAQVRCRYGDQVIHEKGKTWDGFFERGVKRTLERAKKGVKMGRPYEVPGRK
ncbi:MAG: hypothetical protein M1814_001836 [Vezdaea aestivalis]|nr:MAG: hypothetical protein M1814_001836 [Vezdaea aestivalis]